MHDICPTSILKPSPCSAVIYSALLQALSTLHPAVKKRSCVGAQSVGDWMTGVGMGAPTLAAESQHGEPQASSAFRWDYPFETQPWPSQLQYFSLASPRELGGCVSLGIYHEQHMYAILQRVCSFVSNEQMPHDGDRATTHLVSRGLVYAAKVLPGEFYQQNPVQIWNHIQSNLYWQTYTCMENISAAELNLR